MSRLDGRVDILYNINAEFLPDPVNKEKKEGFNGRMSLFLSAEPFHMAYMAGITTRVRRISGTMEPAIGAAILFTTPGRCPYPAL